MAGRMPQLVFYAVLAISGLAVIGAGVLVLVQEPQLQALLLRPAP